MNKNGLAGDLEPNEQKNLGGCQGYRLGFPFFDTSVRKRFGITDLCESQILDELGSLSGIKM